MKNRKIRKGRKKTKKTSAARTKRPAPDTITLTINGQSVKVKRGTTILEAALMLKIDIPTLCYHKALSPYGACRLCVVEIIQNG